MLCLINNELLHLIYLSYLSNIYHACSFFTNLDLFCIDNGRVIFRKIRYIVLHFMQWKKSILSLIFRYVIFINVRTARAILTVGNEIIFGLWNHTTF